MELQVITITVSVLLGFFVFGFIAIFFMELIFRCCSDSAPPKKLVLQYSDRAVKASTSRAKPSRRQTLASIAQFFDVVLPLEFTERPWYKKFWVRILERHSYIAFLAPAEGRENYTAKKWLGMCFELLNVIFIDAIFAPIAAPDAGVCDRYTTASSCLKPSSIDLIDPLCKWKEEEGICEFREIDQNLGVIIIAVLMIKLMEYPLMALCEYLVDQVGNNNILMPEALNKTRDSSKSSVSIGSPARKLHIVPVMAKQESFEDRDLEYSNVMPFAKVIPLAFVEMPVPGRSNVERHVLYRLAARCRFLQQNIDKATVEEEVDYLMTHADLLVKSDVIEQLLMSLIVKSDIKDAKNRDKLLSRLRRARDFTRTVLQELEEKGSRDDKEVYLAKRFIVELLHGASRWVGERFFFDETESEISAQYRAFCTILLILIICGELTYVFLTGANMGANATTVWLICLAVVVLQGRAIKVSYCAHK